MTDRGFGEPPPSPAAGDLWADVIEDMRRRRQFGIDKYGTPLQAHNGRRPERDAYEEALDLCVYLRQAAVEADDVRATLERLREAVEAVLFFATRRLDSGDYDVPEDVFSRLRSAAGAAVSMEDDSTGLACAHGHHPATQCRDCELESVTESLGGRLRRAEDDCREARELVRRWRQSAASMTLSQESLDLLGDTGDALRRWGDDD